MRKEGDDVLLAANADNGLDLARSHRPLAFDALVNHHGMEKTKTIGDTYLATVGIPTHRSDRAVAAVLFACAVRS